MLMKIYFFEFHCWNLWTCSYTITRMISAKRFLFQGTKRNLLSLIRIKDILCRHFIPSNIYKSCNISGQDMQLKTFYMLENEKTFAFENTSKKKSGKLVVCLTLVIAFIKESTVRFGIISQDKNISVTQFWTSYKS